MKPSAPTRQSPPRFRSKRPSPPAWFLLAALALAGCAPRPAAPAPAPTAAAPAGAGEVLIRDVTVISPERGQPLAHAHVLLRGGRIASVGVGRPREVGAGATIVEGAGRFLVPGLIDGHVHLAEVPGVDPQQLIATPDAFESYFRQLPRSYLYFGFTAVVDLNVVDRGRLDRLRAAELGPAIFDCGGGLVLANGYPMANLPPAQRFAIFPNFLYDARQAGAIPPEYPPAEHSPAAAVGRVAAGGGICVKAAYEPGFGAQRGTLPVLTVELAREVHAQSRARHLPLLLHANSLAAHRFAVDAGVDAVAHGLWNWDGATGAEGALPPEVARVLDDEVRAGIAMLPTSRVMSGLEELFAPGFLDDPQLARVLPAELLAWYRSEPGRWFARAMARDFEGVPAERVRQIFRRGGDAGRAATLHFARRGGNLLFGSDTPSAPTYANPPGYNGHLEMRELERAGLSPAQILAAATRANAAFFGLSADYGTIEPGKRASLLLLRADPLASVSAFDTIESVIVAGRVVPRAELAASAPPLRARPGVRFSLSAPPCFEGTICSGPAGRSPIAHAKRADIHYKPLFVQAGSTNAFRQRFDNVILALMRTLTVGGAGLAWVALALGACHEPTPSDDVGGGLAPGADQQGWALQKGEANLLESASPIAAGYLHSCALVSGGEVRCWGLNNHGQLGDGTTSDRLTPVPVLQSPGGPPLEGVRALAVDAHQSCAIVKGGEVLCWGRNATGQLGDGTTSDRLTPVPVLLSPGGPRLSGVQALALGDFHTCALLAAGRAVCWGSNFVGQLGDGTTTAQPYPTPVRRSPGGPPLEGVRTLALGAFFGCATVVGGRPLCWGDNAYGQLGDGTTTNRTTPAPVLQSLGGSPLEGVRALALGYGHSCASTSAGNVLCWGKNFSAELGDGTLTTRFSPAPVLQSPGGPPLEGVQALVVGYAHSTCVTVVGGRALCWGANVSGQLGDGTTIKRLTPVPVLQSPGGPPLEGVRALAAGSDHSCASVGDGSDVVCWGRNSFGELGDGTAVDRFTPVPVAFP